MKNLSSALRPRSARWVGLLAIAAFGVASEFISVSHSQAPAPLDPRVVAAVGSLVAQLQNQQDRMVANQTKIEAQTAALAEELRLLKIYSARGGSSLRH